MTDRAADPGPASPVAARPDAAPSPGRPRIGLTVNGAPVDLDVAPDRVLLDVLRDELGLTGTKSGCGIGVCGACSVLVDGRLESACLLLVGLVDGRAVVTIEGLGTPDEPSTVQRAFVEGGGLQCGICTPGQVVAATALLAESSDPSEAAIRHWMAGNLCRCTGYASIVESVRLAARAAPAASAGAAAEPAGRPEDAS